MWTCSGITSSFSITSWIDRQACGVERTSNALVSSTADTPTWSPATSRLTLMLPCSRCGRLMLPSLLLAVLSWLRLSCVAERLLSSSDGTAPGTSDGGVLSRLPRGVLLEPKTSARRSARSLALMYLSSYENRRAVPPALSMRSSHCWIWSR
ncbi:hypothetical protein D3C81_712420 [compost metagenome]